MGMKTARFTLTSARLPGLLLVIAAIAALLSMPTAPTAQAAEVTLVSNLAEGVTVILDTTMAVGTFSSNFGYVSGSTGSLGKATFTHVGGDYEINAIGFDGGNSRLVIMFNASKKGDLEDRERMRVRFIEGTTERVYYLKDAAEANVTSPLVGQVISRTWAGVTSSDLGWLNGDTISVRVEYILPPTGTRVARVADQSLPDGTTARGIWANSETVWISDRVADTVLAFHRSNWSRDSAKDFTGLSAAGNEAATGIWSDGTTMWVGDSGDGELYAYQMSDKSRDPTKDITLDALNNKPQGLWADADTIWVAQLTAQATDKDFDTLHAAANHDPSGIWSDEAIRSGGVDFWVTNYLPSKIFMYALRSTTDIWSTTMTVGKHTSGTQTDYVVNPAVSAAEVRRRALVVDGTEFHLRDASAGTQTVSGVTYTTYTWSDHGLTWTDVDDTSTTDTKENKVALAIRETITTNIPATGAPSIRGILQEGETLTVDVSGWVPLGTNHRHGDEVRKVQGGDAPVIIGDPQRLIKSAEVPQCQRSVGQKASSACLAMGPCRW